MCPNCGWEVSRYYCPNCGQHIASHNKRLWPLVQEFLDEFLRIDSKLTRTLVPLVYRPGYLTTEWAAGKRVRYISPLKLYVTISALCFLAISLRPTSIIAHDPTALSSAITGQDLGPVDSLLKMALPSGSHIDPQSLQQHIFMHLPTASLLLIPVAALVFSLLYARRKRNYVEHLAFTLHYNSFCFLSFAVGSLVPGDLGRTAACVWAIGYLFFAMKAVYEQDWGKTIAKFAIFGAIYCVLTYGAIYSTVAVSAKMASVVSGTQQSGQVDHMHMHMH